MNWNVAAVAYARHRVRRSRIYQSWRTHGRPDGDVDLTFYFWFARWQDEVVLIDTGFESDWFSRHGADTAWTEPPRELLARLGIDPAAVRTVVLTHLHFDHIGNLGLFPRAQFVVQRAEYAFWTGPYAGSPPVSALTDSGALARLHQADQEGRLLLVDGDFELRPGMRLLGLPGHSPGQQGVLIDDAVLLASDAAHFSEEYENDLLFATYTDLPAQLAGYRTLRQHAAAGRLIVPGHDPAILSRFAPLDAAQPHLAVQLGGPIVSQTAASR